MTAPTPLPWNRLLPPDLPIPCFVVDEDRLLGNLAVLAGIQHSTGAKILLALKGFAMFSTFPLLRRVLHGVCASSPHEARLGREEFGREVHAFAAAYSDADMAELAELADHVVFNSFAQLRRFRPVLEAAAKTRGRNIDLGLRINPEHSEGAVPIYDPCAHGSRLGIRRAAFEGQSLEGISGLHFHTLCEQGAEPLARTLDVVEKNFGAFLHQMRWLNFGGGHHITKPGYNLDLLCECITRMQQTYGVQVYLEPGEAVALNTGVLVARVLDVIDADMPVALLDTSAAAHMPDVLEMPYRPEVLRGEEQAELPGEKPWTCRLAGKSCLAGDVIGEYSFDAPLVPGDRLIFLDMAHYSMVKTNTFNGLTLPGIALIEQGEGSASPADAGIETVVATGLAPNRRLRMVRTFGYEDFKTRLS